MAVFRVEKTRDYTVMSNIHLKDKTLSLKAKGLLSMMLSLPDAWNYTTRGLAAICREGVDSIGATIKELENAGYIVRVRLRDARGRITDTEYTIFESPQKKPAPVKPDTPRPYPENPDMEEPDAKQPCTDNPAQSNTDESSTHESSPERSNPHPSRGRTGQDRMDAGRIDRVREEIREQIEYDSLAAPHNREMLDELVEIMVEVMIAARPTICVAGEEHPTAFVQARFRKLNLHHIEFVFDGLSKKRTEVRNIKKYLLTTLFNAPVTMENHYDAQARHLCLI